MSTIRAVDYMPIAVCTSLSLPVPCFRGHVTWKKDEGPVVPSITWRLYDPDRHQVGLTEQNGPSRRVRAHGIDGASDALHTFFDIEAWTPEYPGWGAQEMTDDIASFLDGEGILTHFLSQQDEGHDSWQQSSRYISNRLIIGTHAVVPVSKVRDALRRFEGRSWDGDQGVQQADKLLAQVSPRWRPNIGDRPW